MLFVARCGCCLLLGVDVSVARYGCCLLPGMDVVCC